MTANLDGRLQRLEAVAAGPQRIVTIYARDPDGGYGDGSENCRWLDVAGSEVSPDELRDLAAQRDVQLIRVVYDSQNPSEVTS